MDFWLCFICPARFCELLPDDLECSAAFLRELVSQLLGSFPVKTTMINLHLDFSTIGNEYLVRMHFQLQTNLVDVSTSIELIMIQLECFISKALLQYFLEVHTTDC